MKYFAYGSNMCTNRLRSRVPSAQFYAMAFLRGYILMFDKKSKDGSSKCNVVETKKPQDEVIGVIFEISDEEKAKLDVAEGVESGYRERSEKLYTSSGEEVLAYLYIADDDYIDKNLLPYTWYKDFVVQGAKQHGLPDTYIQKSQAFDALIDTDAERNVKNHQILPC